MKFANFEMKNDFFLPRSIEELGASQIIIFHSFAVLSRVVG